MEEIAKRKPINRQASLVTSKGVSYELPRGFFKVQSDNPIPIRVPPNKNFEDLTGHKFGDLTVMGLARDCLKRYVCRCCCGVYVLRTAKAVKNPKNTEDKCERCAHYDYQRKKGRFNKA
jgi:hypothetical protein